MKKTKITCILCPVGCEITAKHNSENIHEIDGCHCESGMDYIKQEILQPERILTATVKVENGELPLVSVRTDGVIPKEYIMEIMEIIKSTKIEAPVEIGEVVITSPLDLNCNIITTKHIRSTK